MKSDHGANDEEAMAQPNDIVRGLTTKAAKIRALDAAGMSRSEIARFLGISYQHVRNTLVQNAKGAQRTVAVRKALLRKTPSKLLLEKGFAKAADCKSEGADAFTYTKSLPAGAGVYAFVVDGMVEYIGLTSFGIRTRLGHYRYGHKAQRTSARIKQKILAALGKHQHVEVLVAQPPQLEWNGLPVDAAPGLESALISNLQPRWNKQGL